jgi:DNA-binding transcriptional ArsR family regulator
MEEEKILIDRKTLKAIASDTRMDLLKELSKRKYTLSELTTKLNLKGPTIKEHLDNLIDADLVKREESDNKWKYYFLTEKGKKLVKPKEIKVLISFVVTLFATFGLIGYYIFSSLFPSKYATKSYDAAINVTERMMTSKVESAPMAVMDIAQAATAQAEPIIYTSSFNKEIILIIAIFFLIALTIFLLILAIKERKRNKNNCIDVID